MKHSIWNSLRVKLIIYSVASLALALLTELGLGVAVYLLSTCMGISKRGYGMESVSRKIPDAEISRTNRVFHGLHRIRSIESNTLITILLSIVIFGFFLFVIYFLVMTRGITRDMSYLSSRITGIAKGNLSEPVQMKRKDEIGEIAVRINEMTEEIKRLMNAEREALQTNKDLITCVAHDLRTPLTSVIGYLQLAMDTENHTVEERQHYASIASQKATRLEGMIQDLFSYTKLTSGEISLNRHQIDVVKLVEQMVEEYYPQFQENQLEYKLSQNTDREIMNVDPELIARAIQNLIGNAVKYGKDGKKILIDIEKLEHELQIRVTNFGLIIPEESLRMIFEKFYRVEESRSRQTGGTGLGLNIAKEIIVLHGGTICAESGSQGTVFTVALPLELEIAEKTGQDIAKEDVTQ